MPPGAVRREPSRGGSRLAAALALTAAAALGATPAGASDPDYWHTVSVRSLLPSAACTAPQAAPNQNSSALSLWHRHGPCSPLRHRGRPPSDAEILDRDRDRVSSIHRKIATALAAAKGARGGVSLPAHLATSLGSNSYIVSVGLGSPARSFLVEVDTGSDLSWVQCEPCARCYKQKDPLFDPAKSATYSAVPCRARECRGLGGCSPSDKRRCRYVYSYADGSQTAGSLARDTLTLAPSHAIPGFVFGCGEDDHGTFGETDGLLGLSRDGVSLSSQAAAARYGAVFSYCLPSSPSATGYLTLGGSPGAAAPANTVFTAMAPRNDIPGLYFLDLVGVKVAGRAVEVPRATFETGGTIIDSGTMFSYLPPRAYAALRSAFARAMGGYRRAPPLRGLDTCYDLAGRTRVRVPSVELVFADGAALSLGARGVLYFASASQACLAFASTGDETTVNIIGNVQQRTLVVVYDVASHRVGFAAMGCP